MPTASHSIPETLEKLHLEPLNSGACSGDWIANPGGGELASLNPATGETLARIQMAGPADYEAVMARAAAAFNEWRMIPRSWARQHRSRDRRSTAPRTRRT